MSLEPYESEHEVFGKVGFGLPKSLSGAEATAQYRGTWRKKRIDNYADTLVEATGLTRQELRDRLDEADDAANLALLGADRASESGSKQYTDLLARLVAAALLDEAKIDPIAYLIDRIIKLDPLHIRILMTVSEAYDFDDDMVALENADGGKVDKSDIERHAEWEKSDPIVKRGTIRIDALSGAVGLAYGIVESCLDDLRNVGFVHRSGGDYRPAEKPFRPFGGYTEVHWQLTSLGVAAADEIAEVKRDLGTPSR